MSGWESRYRGREQDAQTGAARTGHEGEQPRASARATWSTSRACAGALRM